MRERVEIGGTPHAAPCAALGVTKDFDRWNMLECRAYIAALKKVYGQTPGDSAFMVKSIKHEFGVYREVAYSYDSDDAVQRAYADEVENGLENWADAGFHTPVIYDEKSQPQMATVNLALIDMAAFAAATKDAQRAAVVSFLP